MAERTAGDISEQPHETGSVPLTRGLSTKLLLLTVLFVMIAEVLIFIPSVANFGMQWMQQRLDNAAAVSIILMEGEDETLAPPIRDELLMATGVKAIAVRDADVSRILVVTDMPPEVNEHIDLDAIAPPAAIAQTFSTLFFGGDRVFRIFGTVGDTGKIFEILIADTGLRDAMLTYARNVAFLSLIISLFTATLVFYAINRIMIRPIRGMTQSMLSFAAAPDEPGRVITPEVRGDEIGVAERELARMQAALQKTLGEQKRLADLGLAVSKINHDMRNMLASAHLISDRLSTIDDPAVKTLTPRLLRTLDRAVTYSEGVLNYGRTQEAPPSRRRLRLHALVEEVRNVLPLDADNSIEFANAVDEAFEISADSEHLFRVLSNLSRNAVQAMAGDHGPSVVRRLTISAERVDHTARIYVTDTGPGLPQKARENLFAPFRGSAKSGGTGLGLAIAQELVRAHGGALELVESTGGHTVFAITIPDATPPA
ncbi:integral membrane sensor signal transduction histidine kinase [Nitratireductor aquibiodomus RA22]|uniref:histidine kinase n=2 Tax=Nitratireductor aquibiodomus TaxID=204799 RepID=A0A1H4M9B3_9HYPH|nr:HAMP domain-containing sensor histidine kinase [Nitratireductor aquibiodomus]EIM71959.1 integral membrane sensor signal transduction histidine kinase [Nitratireductor aquibiodomus RA22]SEB79533.1 Signal transduction histidine kinase [Nitratireductor aquibiodomus]